MATVLSIFIILIHFPFFVLSAALTTFQVPSGGPESYAFKSPDTQVFFTGANDGRVLKYGGPNVGFQSFSYASPYRTSEVCDGTTDPELGYICGRVLGLVMNYKTNKLIIADAYHGLNEVGADGEGGLATQLANSAEGLPFKWLDGVDVSPSTGNIYFTDVSLLYNLSQVNESVTSGEATGRFIEYDPQTNKTRVLLKDLQGAGGVGASEDGSFVLLSEFTGNRITKYWLTGPKADTSELLLNIPGPANLKRLPSSGNYWVAVNNQTSGTNVPTAVTIDKNGKILTILPFPGPPYNDTFITEAHEHLGKLYFASIYVSFGAVYNMVSSSS
ncbi:hypothetical protein M9H77_27908 [Catharanthus roseus]|uniref:Uncharacterized protein n=1 Tax=Catharanthus roseus TaxID=4058 RepID=A0ACC0AFI4_CATRO|nr:hypothetical protein M9H77_27908 [Catharanthus roseus]